MEEQKNNDEAATEPALPSPDEVRLQRMRSAAAIVIATFILLWLAPHVAPLAKPVAEVAHTVACWVLIFYGMRYYLQKGKPL